MAHEHDDEPETDWVHIGDIFLDTATIAVVDPAFAGVLSDIWNEDLESEEPALLSGTFEEVEFVDDEQPETSPATAMLIRTGADGYYQVFGRFCDALGTGMEPCEIRIDIHGHGQSEPD